MPDWVWYGTIGFFLLIAFVSWLIAQQRKRAAAATLAEAEGLLAAGSEAQAVDRLCAALELAVEAPHVEARIIPRLQDIYSRHGLPHQLDDILKLTGMYEELLKGGSSRAKTRQALENQKLKLELIRKLPRLVAPTR